MRTLTLAVAVIGLLPVVQLAAASPLSAQAETKPALIPFVLRDGNIVVAVEFGASDPLPFIFDSGLSNGNIVSPQVAKQLGLKTQGDLRFGDTSGTGHAARLSRVPSIHVGSVELNQQPFAITELPGWTTAPSSGKPIAGFLGAPLMDDAVLCIDYRAKLIRRWKRSEFDSAGMTSMPLHPNHGLPTAVAIIDGTPSNLVIDTGNNSGVSVFPAFADANDLRTKYPQMEVQQGTSGSGQNFDILKTVADEVALSQDTAIDHVSLTVIPQAFDPSWNIDGLMGYQVLSRVNPCIDRDGHRLMWQRG